jgi:galactose mutarotase-like enzyme
VITLETPDLTVEVSPVGARLHALRVAGSDGVRRNVVLGHATDAEHVASRAYHGATVGRYANRIRGGRFTLDGVEVQIPLNDGENALHGGPEGFDRRTWDVLAQTPTSVTLGLVSPDGDQGFPGALAVETTYAVSGSSLSVTMSATTDAPTVVNLTNHAYWNLAGAGSVDDHLLQVHAERYTPVDAASLPTGDHEPVDGTPLDLREPTRIGPVVRSEHPEVARALGVDHNFVLREPGTGLREAATLTGGGLRLTVLTDQPGLQVYTGNKLDGSTRSTTGAAYRQGDGVALEPQLFPDTPNQAELRGWPSARLDPGATYRSQVRWVLEPTRTDHLER